jgi:signal transduction histidine kinase
VHLKRSEDSLRVRVQDDGVGFQARDGKGLGLVGMEERVRELGGTFQVESRSGAGTAVDVEFTATWSVSA